MTQVMFLAKALFDNLAETPDELAFRRGDVLTVVEQNTKGIEGWWLCSLKGKQGIAPGNRLKILSGMGECPGGNLKGEALNKNVMGMQSPNARGFQDYDVPPTNRDFIDMRSSPRRPSYDALRNSAGSRKGSLVNDLYDTPPTSKRGSADNANGIYDTPPSNHRGSADNANGIYDTPPSNHRGSADNANGIYDTPPSSKRASSERTPPHSNRSSASRDSGSNLLSTNPSNQQNGSTLSLPLVVRSRSGSVSSDNCYETPPGSNRSSLERILSEQGPPIYESVSSATSVEHLEADDPVYDTPPSRNHIQPKITPKSQSSLCSAASSESLLSNTSGTSSTNISQTTSLPDSARSSMDLPSEIYDVPPSAHESENSRKQLSVDSGLGFYDSPHKSRPSSSASNTENLRTSQSFFDSKQSPSDKEIKRCKSLENNVDDFYDTPKNNLPKVNLNKMGEITFSNTSDTSNESSSVYDVPPQVTRDSVISVTSNSSDENQRLSSSCLDNEQQLAGALLWDELLLDLNSAQELLVKRQQDISKATSRLSSFVNNTWRTRSSLEKTLYDIKVACTLVKNSLHDFVDFSHGAVANAIKVPDYNLANTLQKYISPLQSTLELVNKSFLKLEEIKWQVSLLSEPFEKTEPDDLSQIALVSKDLMSDVKKVASIIQSNGEHLFKKAVVGESKKPSVSCKPPLGPKLAENTGGKGSVAGQTKGIQHRPLPAVPGSEKSALTTRLPSLADASKLSMYDIKAAIHKDDYAECDELPSITDPKQAHKPSMEQHAQEYDYIQLDQRDSFAKSKQGAPTWDGTKLSGQNKQDIVSKNIKSKQTDPKTSEICDALKDIVQVKENISYGSNNFTNSNIENRFSTNTPGESTSPNSDDTFNQELIEDDIKTPVNVNNYSDSSEFILPSPESGNLTEEPQTLDPNDRQVLVYYTEQMTSHSTLLANAIDAFIGVVSNKEPPNVFISHSKFVVVSAHKLVHIGDSIHRNLVSNSVSMRIMQCANHLCDCLKASVTATKTAALQYPSPPAVQEMVDRVVAVSHAAHQLKVVITHAAK